MSVSAAAAVAASLWKALRPHLARLGHWLMARLESKGVKKVLSFMELRMETFAGRLERAKTKRRKSWLRGRMKRWSAAFTWLKKHGKKLVKRVVRALSKRAAKGKVIPWDASGERYSTWKKMRAAA